MVDRLVVNEKSRSRLFEAIELSCKMAGGKVLINVVGDKEILMSENYACTECDYSLEELEPRMFHLIVLMELALSVKDLALNCQLTQTY